jgi:hypothetical protein
VLLDSSHFGRDFMKLAVMAEYYPSTLAHHGKPFVVCRIVGESVTVAMMKLDIEWRIRPVKRFWKSAPKISIEIKCQFIHVL